MEEGGVAHSVCEWKHDVHKEQDMSSRRSLDREVEEKTREAPFAEPRGSEAL